MSPRPQTASNAAAEAETQRYRVEGMDCPSCAAKIETALTRIEGVSEVKVNYAAAVLTLRADGNSDPAAQVTSKLDGLGYTAKRINATTAEAKVESRDHDHDHGHDDHHDHGDDDRDAAAHWWQSRKGKLVIGIGALLGAAFILGRLLPDIAPWTYGAAAIIGLAPFARRAMKLALSGSPFSIETLMTVAAIGAIAIGASAEAATVVFLFSVGELLESVAASSARSGIKSLMSIVPKTALLIADGKTTEVAADRLAIGDLIQIRPGDRVPADGVVSEGSSSIDEAPVTGESMPVAKAAGDPVFAGTINVAGVLVVKVTKPASDIMIARIIHLVEEAQGSRAPMARFIDQFSRFYTPGAMAVSALVIAVPPLVFGADWPTWIYRGLSILLIACPCALVLSTPAAIASGLAAGARRGLLLKGGAALEALGKIKTVAFDKTGTLTTGRPVVTDIADLSGRGLPILALAAAVEDGSAHPLARAINERAQNDGITVPAASNGRAVAGKAVQALVDGSTVSVGSPRFAEELEALRDSDRKWVNELEEQGKTVVVVIDGAQAIGLIAIRDEPRPDAVAGIAALHKLGVRTIMLTGDNARTAKAIAGSLNLEARADLLPEDKLREIASLKNEGPVAMIGDGINDAPALASASVGIAMGGGTDVALETADGALMKERVTGIAELIQLSRATLGNVRQNVAISLGLKAVFLVTSLSGATPLWMAILADTGATVIVTLNALRLLRFRPRA